jgi:hypothetical protein
MTTTFLEPGGDADFGIGLWDSSAGAPSIVSDFVHGSHVKSLKTRFNASTGDDVRLSGRLSDAGGRITVYFYLNALPSITDTFLRLAQTGFGSTVLSLRITTGGVLQLWKSSAQIGSNGSTLSTGVWYRITLCWKITSTTVNQFATFVNGTADISVTNATLDFASSADFRMGNVSGDSGNADFRFSDFYMDDSNALTDPGNIYVTAKRPYSNGSANNWSTQVGSGNSGYGFDHSRQINERPNSDSNGWSEASLTNTIEEYSIESVSQGDINILSATIIDFMGWVRAKSTASETARMILAGNTYNIALTTSIAFFKQIAGSTIYPQGNTDIGIETPAVSVQTETLYEAGIIVAYIPGILVQGQSQQPTIKQNIATF